MKTVTEMTAEISALHKSIGDLRAQAQTENRELKVEEDTLINATLDQIEKLEKLVRTEKRLQDANTRLATPTTDPIMPAINTTDPENRSLITISDTEKFSSFGEQLVAVYRAGLQGGTTDPRLNMRAASGLNETVPADGGFLVQKDFSAAIMQEVFDTGLLASRCQQVTISGNANGTTMNGIDETSRATGSRFGGVRGYWLGEADEKLKSKPKFREIELKLKKLIGLCYATDENLQDAAQLEGIISAAFISEFGFLLDEAIISGTGAGQPLGVLTGGNDKPTVQVTREAGQPANTIVYENIVKMWSRLFANSRGNSVWLINQDVEPQLNTMSIAVGTGGIPVYMPAGGFAGASATPFSTLMSRPVIPIEQCKTLGTAGDIILADLSGYILARKGGIKQDMSIHVRFNYDESVFRFVMRVDGQPKLASSITPFNSSATLSNFVKLQTRS